MTTKTGTRRNVYMHEETRKVLSDIGGGNYSKGLRIAAMNHEALVEAIAEALTDVHVCGDVTSDTVAKFYALLAQIEGEGK